MSQIDLFTARAAEARAAAEAESLGNAKERHLRSAAAWEALARRALKTEAFRAEEQARRAAADDGQS